MRAGNSPGRSAGRGCGGSPPTASPADGCSSAGLRDDRLLLLALLARGLLVALRVAVHAAGGIGIAEGGLGGQVLDVVLGAGLEVVVVGGGHECSSYLIRPVAPVCFARSATVAP